MTPEPETAHTALAEWNIAVARELGLESTPMTAFLVGVAVGRADDPAVAARDYVEKLSHLADGWDADEERGEPANDQPARG